MTRGRKKDHTIPVSRSLVTQRAYRARKAAHLQNLEEHCRQIDQENGQLKRELAALRQQTVPTGASRLSFSPQTAEAVTDLLHQLETTARSLQHVQQAIYADAHHGLHPQVYDSRASPHPVDPERAHARALAGPSRLYGSPPPHSQSDFPSHLESLHSPPGSPWRDGPSISAPTGPLSASTSTSPPGDGRARPGPLRPWEDDGQYPGVPGPARLPHRYSHYDVRHSPYPPYPHHARVPYPRSGSAGLMHSADGMDPDDEDELDEGSDGEQESFYSMHPHESIRRLGPRADSREEMEEEDGISVSIAANPRVALRPGELGGRSILS